MNAIVLYDAWESGHHPNYVSAYSRALSKRWPVIVIGPRALLASADPAAECVPLPDVTGQQQVTSGPTSLQHALRYAARRKARRFIHLYADPDVRALSLVRTTSVPISALILGPRSHYPAAFGDNLTARERISGWRQDRWIVDGGRSGVTYWSPDRFAVARWRSVGVSAHEVMEPSLPFPPFSTEGDVQTDGSIVLYGHLSERKGLDVLTDALTEMTTPPTLRLLGTVDDQYRSTLNDLRRTMTRSGVEVDLRLQRLSDAEAQDALQHASLAVLPYRRHIGMSRVLLEAAWAGTPVVATRFGLLGWMVEHHRLGSIVPDGDPTALRIAIQDELVEPASQKRRRSLLKFATDHSEDRFATRITSLV